MLSMYGGQFCIKIKGISKDYCGRRKKDETWIIPEENYIKLKAHSMEEFQEKLHKAAQDQIADWKRQLNERAEKEEAITLVGYNAQKQYTPYFYSPHYVIFTEMTYEIIRDEKLYDFKDRTMQECMEQLTPAEFQQEFSFLFRKD